MLTGFDQATIAVADVDGAVAGYRRLLGLEPSWHATGEGGTRGAAFELGNARVVLLAADGDGALARRARARLDAEGEGLCGMAFATGDLDACAAELSRAGVRADATVEDGQRALTLGDGDDRGVWTRIVERETRIAEAAPAKAPPAGCVVALDHIVINTRDADAAIALYRDRLGIRLALDREFPGRGARLVFFRVGGVTVELAARAGAAGEAGSDQLHGLAYRVRDAAAAHARLSAAGFALNDVRPGNKAGTEVFTVKDGTCGVPTLVLRDPARER